ncbi:hypothetical protein EAH84_08055 [Sphingomonas oligophenolica]|uniref:CYTH domain-containing protein n=1 Tax=Sphingomonas oligophenolica TaxID=301154 RepID=A0A502CMB3_9SPHN|nr:hypothetical protein EAH84_08055 [Sphingomonas oligophenolica]
MLRGLDEELRAHKYSHVERERRFLVDPIRRPDLTAAPHLLIEDRYIDGSRMRLRRMTHSDTGRVVLKLSKKYDVADVLARPMVTAYLDEAEYALLAELPARALTKRRHPVDAPGGCFGFDRFEGSLAGLELAEIEFDDPAIGTAIPAPAWTVREVSYDPRFQGGALASLDHAATRALLAAR